MEAIKGILATIAKFFKKDDGSVDYKVVTLFVLFFLALSWGTAGTAYSVRHNRLLKKSRQVVEKLTSDYKAVSESAKRVTALLEKQNLEIEQYKKQLGIKKAKVESGKSKITDKLKKDLKKIDNIDAEKLKKELRELGY